ncbi:MAG: undecaprenyldiphospho-muramoylpentapeptide beta-N-acetylglucosaminyltransferase [Alphaproteobacteria bacterium]
MKADTPRHPAIVLASGGTGGHVFPADALARELVRRGISVYLFTDKRGAAFGAAPGAETGEIGVRTVPAARLARNPLRLGHTLVQLGRGVCLARRALKAVDAAAVVGFGGYPSLPTLMAARLLRLPIILHEQNAVLGRANRLMAPAARIIATSFAAVKFLKPRADQKVVLTGNPVRAEIADIGARTFHHPAPSGPVGLLVFGGSQGAAIFSRVVPEALARLDSSLRTRIKVVQQCREEDLERVRTIYAAAGIEAETRTFFDDMPARLVAAHLVIARAGASTVAELAAAHRPAVLVPYPHAADNHQRANAEAMAAAGAAVVIPEDAFDAERLADHLADLLRGGATGLRKTASAAGRIARPAAARHLADLVLAVTPSLDAGEDSEGTTRSTYIRQEAIR